MAEIYANSNRLTLRQLCMSDVTLLHRYLSDFNISKWFATIPYPLPEDYARNYVANQTDKPNSDSAYAFAIVENATEMFVGIVSYRRRVDGKFAISGWLAKDYWSRGYVSEATRMLIDYLYKTFGNNIEIAARHMTNNEISAKILKKLGFHYTNEQIMVDCLANGGEKQQFMMMQLNRVDYMRAIEFGKSNL